MKNLIWGGGERRRGESDDSSCDFPRAARAVWGREIYKRFVRGMEHGYLRGLLYSLTTHEDGKAI